MVVLAAGSALVAGVCFFEVGQSLLSGHATLGLRHNAILVSVSREQSKVGFFLVLAIYALLGIGGLVCFATTPSNIPKR